MSSIVELCAALAKRRADLIKDVYDLVLTQEIIYKTLGSTVELVCPIVKTYQAINWLGPSNYQHYSVGTEVFPEVSTQVAVSETAADKKSILVIHSFSKENSGKYKCRDAVDKHEFILIVKRNPSNLVIVNETDDTIYTVEGREHNLECRVTSGQPGGNITWSTDGAIVARNEPSFVSYRFIPQRSDNEKLFKCEAFNSEGNSILESSVLLEVFYIPKITFDPNQTIAVKEGDEAQLICSNDGNDPNATTVWKIERTKAITSKNDKLYFNKVNRTDTGLYTCIVDTKAGVYEDNATVVVQYAPTIEIRYFPIERKLKCIPSGIPDSYVFQDWEHTTEYNDHIQFLATRREGKCATLTIPQNVTRKDHHRDSGIYICRASNNISSTDGMFVMRKYNLNLTGTPYFVSSTENTQYGDYLKTAEIKIKFVSVPEYTSYDVYRNETKFADYTESVNRNIRLTDNIYGKNVSVKGSIISLQIQIDTLDDFNSYKIVVKNAIGSSAHTIELVSASPPCMPKILRTVAQQTQIFVLWIPGFDGGFLQWFIIEYKEIGDLYWKNQTTRSSNSIVIGGLQPATKYLIRMFSRNMIDDSNRTEEILIKTGKLKQRFRERMEPAINFQTPEGTFGESSHYIEVVEVDNLQPTSQENDNSIMLMINRDIDQVSATHTSTSSDNDRDPSEYLDDGYEQPYTTLMVTDQVKDEHVYLTTKKESNYENIIPYQNVACGHACECFEADSLPDKTNAHDDHANWNLNNDMNDFNETNDSVPHTYIYPQINKAEYINLSLNQ
ncbi:unnamed protein product [Mytilus coruscus]|uniref:NCAM n=1 Tax=Mytilus coruscus TaxID=42192 RepID=A0A6J8EP05_MYTCO|nr:unnamed protein product [Mytilus coruscus]